MRLSPPANRKARYDFSLKRWQPFAMPTSEVASAIKKAIDRYTEFSLTQTFHYV
jgi:hypothetical protein